MYNLDSICPAEEILFLDIETTGFSPKSSSLYLIGAAYLRDGIWNVTQWFADTPEEEPALLNAFLTFLKDFTTLCTFNGDRFDLPFLAEKCTRHSIKFDPEDYGSIDIYKRIYPYKSMLYLTDCKQKTIERFLDIERDDTMNGGELIDVYLQYGEYGLESDLDLLLLHNFDDMRGMLKITSVLSYHDLIRKPVVLTKAEANTYNDRIFGERSTIVGKNELLMHFTLETPVPKPVSYLSRGCYLSVRGNRATLKVPIFDGELKYFYAGYRDYYYLPAEDMAIHRSVAAYVDKVSREPAKASNCYTRKRSSFLPQMGDLFTTPFYKESYDSKELFFELTDELKTDRDFFSEYASYCMNIMMM